MGIGPALNLLYVCKAVDEADPSLANQVRWIRALAGREGITHVTVLTPRQGRSELPANVTVRAFGSKRPLRLLKVVLRFNLALLRGPRPDLFFVSQGGPYPALLLPWKLVLRRPLYQWKAMPHISRRMRFYARFCDDLIFTATPGSFPLRDPKVRVVGHGIDTQLFQPGPGSPSRDLVYVTRIAPVKRLEHAVRAVSECRARFGVAPTLDIVGPCDSRSHDYRRRVIQLIDDLDLEGTVRLVGGVDQAALSDRLGDYRVAVNFAETALDKAAGEAMAAGLPVVTTNSRVAEVLPVDLRRHLSAPAGDVPAAAGAIQRALSWDEPTRHEVGRRLRQVIVDGHSLESLFDRVFGALQSPDGAGGPQTSGEIRP